MSPLRKKNAGAKGCTSIQGKKQTSIFNFMCPTSLYTSSTSPLNQKTPQKSGSGISTYNSVCSQSMSSQVASPAIPKTPQNLRAIIQVIVKTISNKTFFYTSPRYPSFAAVPLHHLPEVVSSKRGPTMLLQVQTCLLNF